VAATPSKTTPNKTTKQTAKKEESTSTTSKRVRELPKFTNLARNKTATLPITAAFQGDNVESKHVKGGYTHTLKLDATSPFTLLDSVSQYLHLVYK
jgi:hypothetical protein